MKALVFAYDDYYPGGGLGDCQGVHDTLEGAEAAAAEHITRDKNVEIMVIDDHGDILQTYWDRGWHELTSM